MTLSEFKPHLNSVIEITTIRGAKYGGVLAAIRQAKQQICLTQMTICNKDGSYKAEDKHGCSRAFNLKSIANWRLVDNICHICGVPIDKPGKIYCSAIHPQEKQS